MEFFIMKPMDNRHNTIEQINIAQIYAK
jgi:hypothetical protein